MLFCQQREKKPKKVIKGEGENKQDLDSFIHLQDKTHTLLRSVHPSIHLLSPRVLHQAGYTLDQWPVCHRTGGDKQTHRHLSLHSENASCLVASLLRRPPGQPRKGDVALTFSSAFANYHPHFSLAPCAQKRIMTFKKPFLGTYEMYSGQPAGGAPGGYLAAECVAPYFWLKRCLNVGFTGRHRRV